MSKEKNKEEEMEMEDIAISIEVEDGVIDGVLSGDIQTIILDLNEEDKDGIKESVMFIMLHSEERHCLARIINSMVVHSEDESGYGEEHLDIVPVIEGARTYLMRWNPAISSFTEKDYMECIEKAQGGNFFMDWSISEWEEARRGDYFYMMRVGDDKAGIVFNGQFLTDPYPDDDWKGSSKRRMYVGMVCSAPSTEEDTPLIPLDRLQESIPEIEWAEGHSGVLLPEDIVEKLDEWS